MMATLKIRALFHLWLTAERLAEWASTKATEAQIDLIVGHTDIQAEFDQMMAA